MAGFLQRERIVAPPRWSRWLIPPAALSMSCFVSGFLISALGLYLRQYWLVVAGYGFVGGIGLGIGYISPVSTLIKWFPDRPGLLTGTRSRASAAVR